MLSFHNDPTLKEQLLAQLEEHQIKDEIVQKTYWSPFYSSEGNKWRGCNIGCVLYPSGHNSLDLSLQDLHREVEKRYGVHRNIARLFDAIHEGITPEEARYWPLENWKAVPVGINLTHLLFDVRFWFCEQILATTNPKYRRFFYQIQTLCCGQVGEDESWETITDQIAEYNLPDHFYVFSENPLTMDSRVLYDVYCVSFSKEKRISFTEELRTLMLRLLHEAG